MTFKKINENEQNLSLIHILDSKIHKEQSDLFTTSISEVCFYTDDIDLSLIHI